MADLLEATPRPWVQFLDRERNTVEFLPAGCPGTTEVLVRRIDLPSSDANAALIVKAVNLYDELVAALRGLMPFINEGEIENEAVAAARVVLKRT